MSRTPPERLSKSRKICFSPDFWRPKALNRKLSKPNLKALLSFEIQGCHLLLGGAEELAAGGAVLWDCCPLEDLSHRLCTSYRTVSAGHRESPQFVAAGGLWVCGGCGLARAGLHMLQATRQCEGCIDFLEWKTIDAYAKV